MNNTADATEFFASRITSNFFLDRQERDFEIPMCFICGRVHGIYWSCALSCLLCHSCAMHGLALLNQQLEGRE